MNAPVIPFPALQASAEFHLCMARVLMAPELNLSPETLLTELLPDLQALSSELPALNPEFLQQLEQALQQLPDREALLREYSQLFLVPPAPAPLNLGYYLDGGLMGRTTQALETFYERQALARNPAFRDLPDHLALTLEWLAWTLATAVEYQNEDPQRSEQALQDLGTALYHYLLPGTEALLHPVQTAATSKNQSGCWSLLLQLIHHQMAADLQQLKALLPEQALQDPVSSEARAESADGHPAIPMASGNADETLHCTRCGVTFQAGEMLGTLLLRLREAGLTTDHVEICPSCRDAGVQVCKNYPA
ncbi:molecular chaperone TorD family protein [Marinospirillum alkaliphilum]|uniref:Chaperone TorD involved in molybdoenzyme TorA maturation n=1 Tax=Marinospirillum alkaliphilum DSM 21637 TaxID=1122209 RepID=A0A1K1ZM13_9GAMM|nr:molecular chaperone TorD family protein [Marinospirillum alkaliphilum]SFX74708.1 chaperone TorD involved in molybdoenzyme TorA maturation [Marinospirillum alkaliphilum DSM 21637]